MTLIAVLPFPAFECWTNHCLMTNPDFSPAFEAKQPRWFWMLGLLPRTPQAYPLRYVEEAEEA